MSIRTMVKYIIDINYCLISKKNMIISDISDGIASGILFEKTLSFYRVYELYIPLFFGENYINLSYSNIIFKKTSEFDSAELNAVSKVLNIQINSPKNELYEKMIFNAENERIQMRLRLYYGIKNNLKKEIDISNEYIKYHKNDKVIFDWWINLLDLYNLSILNKTDCLQRLIENEEFSYRSLFGK